MARYVLDGKPWEIRRIGSSLEIVENDAKPVVRKFVSTDAAQQMLVTLVRERLAAGYVLVDEPPPPPPPVPVRDPEPQHARSIELERAIAADPYDPGPYLVYADWLQAQGDPRGELIVRMSHGAEVHELVKTHKRHLFGSLAPRILPPLNEPPLIWRLGFIHRIELERERRGKDIAPQLEMILTHPSGALVVEAVLRSDDLADLRATLAILVRVAPPLRVLEIASATEIGDLGEVLEAFPKLKRLSVKMRSRRQQAPGVAPSTLRSVAAGVPATVERLELRIGAGEATAADLAPLFARELPRLTHLRLRDAPFADELVGAVLAAPFVGQLAVLDFGLGALSLEAARELAGGKEQLRSLVELWVSHDRVPIAAMPGLARLAKNVVELSREPVDVGLAELAKKRYARSWE